MKTKTLAQGAEATITLTPSPTTLHKNIVTKNRTKKSYRLPQLDEKIRKSRTKSESKILIKSSEIINTPQVLKTDKFQIQMQHIPGERLSETLNQKPKQEQIQIIKQIAEQIAKLHDNNIIHGDLTTSNTLLLSNSNNDDTLINSKREPRGDHNITSEARLSVRDSEPIVYIIDFGLSFISTRIEDKAVDIHLIRQALEAKHYQNWEKLFQTFLNSYNPKEKTKILEQLKKVESRGRYKH